MAVLNPDMKQIRQLPAARVQFADLLAKATRLSTIRRLYELAKTVSFWLVVVYGWVAILAWAKSLV